MAESGALVLHLADEAATARLAEDVAAMLKSGDIVALSGDLGAGKSAFARAAIRALAGRADLEVPSPTYTMIQTYELPRFTVAHVDLYRVTEASELDEIGFDAALREGVVFVEWPERAPDRLPESTLHLRLAPGDAPQARRATLWSADPRVMARFARSAAIRDVLDGAGFAGARRRYLQGDASMRAYERVESGGRRAVLLDQMPESDDEAGGARRAYRASARLAEDAGPFVAIARGLGARGVSVPEIFATDVDAGIVLMEDLGEEGVVAGDPPAPIPERYRAAAEMLARLHGLEMPAETPGADGAAYPLPVLDRTVLQREVAVLIEWGIPFALGRPASREEDASFTAIWDRLLDALPPERPAWVLRDFHSPNLLWLAHRTGPARVGVLDFQDAVLGPAAYDLASLAQDARVTVAPALEAEILDAYAGARLAACPTFEEAAFRRAYAILAAQRATRLCGLFPRLLLRDGKEGYLAHLPRVSAYLERLLAEPVLRPLKLWYDAHLPAERRTRRAAG